jgi:hypothetical protein
MADMAFQAFNQQLNQLQAQVRQWKVGKPLEQMTGAVQPGSLIIADLFTPSSPEDKFAHGEMVGQAATGNGFRGPILTQAQPGSNARVIEQAKAQNSLLQPLTPEETRASVASFGRNSALQLLERQTQVVGNATASGAKNSALNISMGGSVASDTLNLFAQAGMAWNKDLPKEAQQAGLQISTNFAKAYGLDVAKLTSDDPKVAGPERVKLQEALAKGLDASVQSSPEVAKARRDFATAVGRFESGRNSVVIAAGNEGDFAAQMAKESHGYQAKNLPSSFNTNYLDTPEATMVGATRWHNTKNGGLQERQADYTNVNAGVDLYASGSLSTDGDQKADTHGTSFAAPRVAATMASLHKANPTMSSSQIEALMRNSLTHNLNSGSGSISVLDFQRSSSLNASGGNPQ